MVSKGASWSWLRLPPPRPFLPQRVSPVISEYLQEMLSKRVVEVAKSPLLWQSRLFTVPKKDTDKLRVILDVSSLNHYVYCPYFKMLTLREVKLLLPWGFFTVSLDLKDGYWHVPIAPAKRPYLGFQYLGIDYWFRALPFGLNVAPRIFTKLVTAVIRIISGQGIFILAYLDDLLIAAPTASLCAEHLRTVLQLLSDLGWIVNMRKSRLHPSQSFQWLGLHWDLSLYHCNLTDLTQVRIQQWIAALLTLPLVSRRRVMQAQGLFNWGALTDLGVRPLLSMTRSELSRTRKLSLDFQYPPPRSFRLDMASLRNLRFTPQPLGVPPGFLQIMTDASSEGWGIVLPHAHYSGRFDSSLLQEHIILKELITIFWALLLVPDHSSVMVHTDSLSSIHILRGGYSRTALLDRLSRVILQLVTRRSITLRLSFLPGNYNVRADQLSRGIAISTEWSLSDNDYETLLHRAGFIPQIDLFATDLNTRCELYMSPCPDPRAVAIDAFNHCWDNWRTLYLFPPTPLISRALAKLRLSAFDRAIFVCPMLAGRPWYPGLSSIAQESIRLSLHLQQLVQDSLVVQTDPTRLIAFVLSGSSTLTGSQMTL